MSSALNAPLSPSFFLGVPYPCCFRCSFVLLRCCFFFLLLLFLFPLFLFLFHLLVNMWHMDGHCGRLWRLPVSFWAQSGVPTFPCALCDLRLGFVTIFIGSSETLIRTSSIMVACRYLQILRRMATTTLLTNCPRTAAALGELATQWQQLMAVPAASRTRDRVITKSAKTLLRK